MNPIIARMAIVHRKLDDEIRRERKRRAPDMFRMQRLKLAIKDRLHRRAGHLLPA